MHVDAVVDNVVSDEWNNKLMFDAKVSCLFAKAGEKTQFVVLAPEGDEDKFYIPVTNYWAGQPITQYMVKVLRVKDNAVLGLVLPPETMKQLMGIANETGNLGHPVTTSLVLTKPVKNKTPEVKKHTSYEVDPLIWECANAVEFKEIMLHYERIVNKNRSNQLKAVKGY
jgi:hypothetical protein